MYAFNLLPDGTPNDQTPLIGDTLLLDSGVYTLDCVYIKDGKVSPEQTFSLQDKGLDYFIRKPLMQAAHESGRDFSGVTEDDIDVLIRSFASAADERGQQTACALNHGGYVVDLYPVMTRAISSYVNWIGNNILPRFDGLRGVKHVVLIGGGASLITPLLCDLYPEKIKNSSTPPHYALSRIAPHNLNVIGGLRVALAKVGV